MTDIENVITSVLTQIDNDREYLVNLTQQMVEFKSINPVFMPDPENSEEAQCQAFMNEQLRALGLEIEMWEGVPNRPNIVAKKGGSGQGQSLIINGHIDVVPTGEESAWSVDPWGSDVKNGKIYGRGTFDMKGAVAAFITATKALQDVGVNLAGDLLLHVVVDEESGGSAGTREIIRQGHRGDAVIVAEPTTGDIHHAEGGLSWVRVTIPGRADHAGVRYAQIYPQNTPPAIGGGNGVNALEIGVRFIQAVQQLERDWSRRFQHPLMPPGITTINPGVMHAGVGLGEDGLPIIRSNPAMIPDTCVIDFDFKFLGDFEDRKADFEAFVAAFSQMDSWLQENPPTIQWHLSNVNFPAVDTPLDHPLADMIRASRSNLGLETVSTGFPAVTDAAFYAGAGMPPLIYGPAGGGAHGLDEWVEIDSLVETAKVYAGTIIRWCGLA